MVDVDKYTTPELVRMYRDLHIQGSKVTLNADAALKLSYVVYELRLRRVLD